MLLGREAGRLQAADGPFGPPDGCRDVLGAGQQDQEVPIQRVTVVMVNLN